MARLISLLKQPNNIKNIKYINTSSFSLKIQSSLGSIRHFGYGLIVQCIVFIIIYVFIVIEVFSIDNIDVTTYWRMKDLYCLQLLFAVLVCFNAMCCIFALRLK